MSSEDWKQVSLGDLLDEVKDRVAPPAFNGARYTGLEHMDPDTRELTRLGESQGVKSQKTLYRAGDVLFGKLRPYLRKVALADHDGICSTDILAFRPASDLVDREFLFYLLSSDKVLGHAIRHSTGTRMPRISSRMLGELVVGLPSLAEQQRIADLLRALDVVAANARATKDVSWNLLAAAVETELERTADGGWESVCLADVADIASGITKGRKTSGDTEAVPFLRAANVQHGLIDLTEIHSFDATPVEVEKFSLRPDDVVLLEGGNKEDVGRGWIWDGEITPCIHQNHVFRARVDQSVCLPRFVGFVVTSRAARAFCLSRARQTSNLASINKRNISELPVPLPPLAEQTVILERLDALRDSAERATEFEAAVKSLRRVTINLTVQGDFRLRENYEAFLAGEEPAEPIRSMAA